MSQNQNLSAFADLGIAPELCTRLKHHHVVTPTPIQAAAIPLALSREDVIGLAQTGTGKTFAFGLPIAQSLPPGRMALVLAPTRELAQQIVQSFAKIGLPAVLVVGGDSMGRQVRDLKANPRVIVATPGRLNDHLDRRSVNLNRVSIVVLDEADRMMDMGFLPAVRRILSQVPDDRQTLLFSATMPSEIEGLAGEFLIQPKRVEIAPEPSHPVAQEVVYLQHERKQEYFRSLMGRTRGTTLVFARTRHGARKLALMLRKEGHCSAEIHSDRTLAQRRAALEGFRSGAYRILVATDIAARGIDVRDIELVVNYDLPQSPEDYIHRIGRTGRAGAKGRAITLALPDQAREVARIERVTDQQIAVSKEGEPIATPRPSKAVPTSPFPRRRQRR